MQGEALALGVISTKGMEPVHLGHVAGSGLAADDT